MLLSFSCSNYKSILDETSICFTADPADLSMSDHLVCDNGENVLPVIAVYGANGSGKSTFLEALQTMCNIASNRHCKNDFIIYNGLKNVDSNSEEINILNMESVVHKNDKIDGRELPTTFKIRYTSDEYIFTYGLAVKDNRIIEEFLFAKERDEDVREIFHRTESITDSLDIKSDMPQPEESHIAYDNRHSSGFDPQRILEFKENPDSQISYLGVLANYSCLDIAESATSFIQNMSFYGGILYNPNWIEIINSFISLDCEEYYEIPHEDKLRMIFNYFGMPVRDFEIGEDVDDFSFVYDTRKVKFINESTGNKKMLGLAEMLVKAIASDSYTTLVFDEIESGLHESIAIRLVELIQALDGDYRIQLLFTTHNTNVLDSNMLRKDQIWFTEMSEEGKTSLYSLAEFDGVRKTDDFEKEYIAGRYGAVPISSMDASEFVAFYEETVVGYVEDCEKEMIQDAIREEELYGPKSPEEIAEEEELWGPVEIEMAKESEARKPRRKRKDSPVK